MKAQYAFEYMMVIAISFAVIIPTSYLFFNYMRESSDQLVYPQIVEIGNTIIYRAESIYYSGDNSRVIIDINMPKNINEVKVLDNTELVFNVSTDMGDNEVIFFSKVNITTPECMIDMNNDCNISIQSSGLKRVKIESVNSGKQVMISKSE